MDIVDRRSEMGLTDDAGLKWLSDPHLHPQTSNDDSASIALTLDRNLMASIDGTDSRNAEATPQGAEGLTPKIEFA
ncbi:MAG: NAD-dependent glutamate dehydrogenase [Chaenotheca gracillima]|nr:MAG: NAD-dependent glutamate dehydrogenase [Chaenotheca gracillima]